MMSPYSQWDPLSVASKPFIISLFNISAIDAKLSNEMVINYATKNLDTHFLITGNMAAEYVNP